MTNAITVRFFARLREHLGKEEIILEAEPGLTAGKILNKLAQQGGVWSELEDGPQVLIAVNQTLAKPDTQVAEGDEVAFFPPVTGG